ncbi:MAG: hypothetical protein L7U47_08320 [Alphaproteobacteria bacterium]|nr:hypothetical protein [Alphaproteobacteria bacterium]
MFRHKRVAIDFDGTLFEDCGNIDVSFDEKRDLPPKNGADEVTCWLKDQGFEILIFTCRPDYHRAYLEDLMTRAGIAFDYILFYTKPRVDLYIDDKGFRFTDWASTRAFVEANLETSPQSTKTDAKNILLLGAGGNAGINFTKSLKLAGGYRTIGVDISEHYFRDGYSDVNVLMPRLEADEKIAFLNRLIEDHEIDFVHAQPDPEVRFLCTYGEKLNVPVGPHQLDKWEAFADKLSAQKIWADTLGLSFLCAPLQACLDDNKLFDAMLEKSGKVWVRAMSGAGSKGALPVTSLEHAHFWADYWQTNRGIPIDEFMVAEFLPGKEYAVQTVWKDGNLLSSQARERVEYFFGSIMPSGQSSTPSVARTVHDEKIYATAYQAVKAVDASPDGIYCVDMKTDAAGDIIPLEVNYGRFFTTSDFFSNLGVNGPDIYIQSALGHEVEPSVETITSPKTWIRGLDREPILADGEND